VSAEDKRGIFDWQPKGTESEESEASGRYA